MAADYYEISQYIPIQNVWAIFNIHGWKAARPVVLLGSNVSEKDEKTFSFFTFSDEGFLTEVSGHPDFEKFVFCKPSRSLFDNEFGLVEEGGKDA